MSILGAYVTKELHWRKTSAWHGEWELGCEELVLGTLMASHTDKSGDHPAELVIGEGRWRLSLGRRMPGEPKRVTLSGADGAPVGRFESKMKKSRLGGADLVAKGGTWTLQDGTSYQWVKPERHRKDMVLRDSQGQDVLTVNWKGLFERRGDHVTLSPEAATEPNLDVLVGASYYVFFFVNGRNDT